jgi:hypothetical protein
MKNLILALTLVCLGFATQAHTIDEYGTTCPGGGKVTIQGKYFDYKGQNLDSVAFYIKSGSVYTFIGSVFVTSGGDFITNIPYYTQAGQTVYFTEYERNNTHSPYTKEWPTNSQYSDGTMIRNTRCTVTPITLTSWTARVDDNDSALVHMAWSVDMESNVAYYRIDGSTDNGKTWDTGVARLNSLGDTNLKRDYKLDYTNPLIGMIAKTAGIGTIGIVLAIAVFAGSMRNKGLAGVAVCLIVVSCAGFVACKKDITAPKQGLKYNAVKLNEVDKDGSVKDFATRQLK